MSDNNCQCHTCVLERRVRDAADKLTEVEKERAGLRLRVCEDERDTRELEKKLAEVEAHRDELGTELAEREERAMALLEDLSAVRVRLGFVPPTLEEALAPDCPPAPTALDMAERVMTKLALLEAAHIHERSEREHQDDAEGKLAKVEAELARIKGIAGLWCEEHRIVDGCGFVIVEANLANTARRLAEVEKLLPRCAGKWVSGGGGHRVYESGCTKPGIWDVGTYGCVCDEHKEKGDEGDTWEWWTEREKLENTLAEVEQRCSNDAAKFMRRVEEILEEKAAVTAQAAMREALAFLQHGMREAGDEGTASDIDDALALAPDAGRDLLTELVALREFVCTAPHSSHCGTGHCGDGVCTCWLAGALARLDAARKDKTP